MTYGLIQHSLLYACAFFDCILDARIPFLTLLCLHIFIVGHQKTFHLVALVFLGLFLDVYTSPFLGISSLFFMMALWFSQMTKRGATKVENFWYVWLSFAVLVILFYVLYPYCRCGLENFDLGLKADFTALLGLFIISAYPLLFFFFSKLQKDIYPA